MSLGHPRRPKAREVTSLIHAMSVLWGNPDYQTRFRKNLNERDLKGIESTIFCLEKDERVWAGKGGGESLALPCTHLLTSSFNTLVCSVSLMAFASLSRRI